MWFYDDCEPGKRSFDISADSCLRLKIALAVKKLLTVKSTFCNTLNNRALQRLIGMALVLQAGPAAAQAFFRSPPTEVSIHNPAPMEGQRNRTTISVRVPEAAGAHLQQVVLSQLTNLDQWNWGRKQPEVYLGAYGLRRRGETGLAEAALSGDGDEVTITLKPAILPGEQVNIVFRGFNPDAGIYQWATRFVPAGPDPRFSDGPTLRVHVYRNDDFR